MMHPVYFDYASTTPVDGFVKKEICKFLGHDDIFGNPASQLHRYGAEAGEAVERSRVQMATALNCYPKDICFTSGATESNNLAIKGVAQRLRANGIHIITSANEHKSVLESCYALEKEGFEVTYLRPNKIGLLDLAQVANAIREDTILVSIMHVNNETGVIQDIQAIGELVHSKGILFHVDAAQSAGKLPIDLNKLPVDFMSMSAHKIYGPKGIGCLYVRRECRDKIAPLIHGGGQEFGLRSGTLPTHQIVGMGEAFRIAQERMEDFSEKMAALRERLLKGLLDIGGAHTNGDPKHCIPNIVNISFEGVDGEALILRLRDDLAISMGSACTSGTIEPSHVLRAMGLDDDRVYGAIRISMGRHTTEEEIDFAVVRIREEVNHLGYLETASAAPVCSGEQKKVIKVGSSS